MFSGGAKVMGEMLGQNDNCTCISKDHVRAEAVCAPFILEEDIPFCLFKSNKQEFVLTDKAMIIYAGEAAAGKKRSVSRFDFYEHVITNVSFETAGLSATDLDCELKFKIANYAISIDIKKSEQDTAIAYYRGILRVSREMEKNVQKFKTLTKALTSTVGISGPELEAQLEHIYNRYQPESYEDVFRSAGFN